MTPWPVAKLLEAVLPFPKRKNIRLGPSSHDRCFCYLLVGRCLRIDQPRKAWPLSVHLLFHWYRIPHTKYKPSTHVNTMAAFGCFQFGLCLCSYLPFPSIQTYFRLLVVLLFLFCLNPRPFVLSLIYTMTFQGKILHSCILYQIHGKLWLQQGVGGDSLQVTAMDILHGIKKDVNRGNDGILAILLGIPNIKRNFNCSEKGMKLRNILHNVNPIASPTVNGPLTTFSSVCTRPFLLFPWLFFSSAHVKLSWPLDPNFRICISDHIVP